MQVSAHWLRPGYDDPCAMSVTSVTSCGTLFSWQFSLGAAKRRDEFVGMEINRPVFSLFVKPLIPCQVQTATPLGVDTVQHDLRQSVICHVGDCDAGRVHFVAVHNSYPQADHCSRADVIVGTEALAVGRVRRGDEARWWCHLKWLPSTKVAFSRPTNPIFCVVLGKMQKVTRTVQAKRPEYHAIVSAETGKPSLARLAHGCGQQVMFTSQYQDEQESQCKTNPTILEFFDNKEMT